MTENEAIEMLNNIQVDTRDLKHALKCSELIETAVKALEEIQEYREIGTVEEIRKIIKQGIDNCYMVHRYEHPGYENDLCAGLRTMNGDGEPCETCQKCYLYYGHSMYHEED